MPDEPQTRAPLSDLMGPTTPFGSGDPYTLRNYGLDLLKQKMWKDLGVDYKTQGEFNDTPTEQEMRRQKAGGKFGKDDLKDLEDQMQRRLQRPPDPLWQKPPSTPINLVPVEHNPHAVTLHAVDEDPFAAKTPPNRLPPRFGTGEADPRLGKAVSGVVQGAVQHLMTPGMVAQPITPTTPGMWSDEDEARRQLTEGAVADWGPKQALNMMRGVPLAAEGTAGVAGGKLKVYHGSPHDFPAERLIQHPSGETAYIEGRPGILPDVPEGATVLKDFPLGRMRMDKIGTGEGAQSYGRGLYSAEREGTAQSYRDALSNDPWRFASEVTRELPSHYQGSRDNGRRIVKDIEDALASGAIKNPEDFLAEYDVDPGLYAGYRKAAELIKNSGGKMYEVEIGADPEHFLHWDKPLSEQSQYVQDAVRKAHEKVPVYLRLEPSHRGEEIYDRLAWQPDLTNIPLKDRYKSRAVSSSEALREAGIPGIKYLDQGSRVNPYYARPSGGGKYQVTGPGNISYSQDFDTLEAAMAAADKLHKPTHNYVMFDDKRIDIIKKYGLAGLIAGGAAHFKTQQVDENPFPQ